MAPQGLGDLLHRLDARAHGLLAPVIEELSGPGRSAEGVVHLGDDVKAVENIDCIGAAFADDPQIGLPHVRADEFDGFGQPIRVKNCSKLSTVRSLPIHSRRVKS